MSTGKPRLHPLGHDRFEGDDPRLAGGLRGVHGDVGVAQRLVGVLIPDAHDLPDAGGDAELPAADRDRFLQHLQDAGGSAVHVGLVGQVVHHHGELVAPEPCHRVHRAQVPGEPSRDLDEHGITGCVPGVVVDLLEPVQVEQEQTDQAMVPGCARQRVGQPVPQHDSIGQAGQRVLERLTEQLVLQGLPVGDVPGVPEESAELSIGQLVRDGGLQRQRPPVVVPDLELDMGRVVGGGPDRCQRGFDHRQVLGMDPFRPDQLGRGAERLMQRGAGVGEHTLAVRHPDQVGRAVDQRLELGRRRLAGPTAATTSDQEQTRDDDDRADQ